jgi:dipeptidyl aminopeptidase/acylaminoacyl peptidase
VLTGEQLVDTPWPDEPCVSPDGRLVAFSSAPDARAGEHELSTLWLAPVDGSSPARRLTAGTANDHAPAWLSQDELVFLSDRAERGTDQVQRLSLRGGEAEALTDEPAGVDGLAVLAGSGQLAILAGDDAGEPDPVVESESRPQRLRLVDLQSGEVSTPAGAGERHVHAAVASPDGTRLALITWEAPAMDQRTGPNQVVPVDAAGEPLAPPWELAGGVWQVVFAGGRLLALADRETGSSCGTAVYALDEGADPVLLASPPDRCVVYLPGGQLAILHHGLDTEVCELDPRTGELRELARLRGEVESPAARGGVLAAVWFAPDAPPEVVAGPPEGPLRRLTSFGEALRDVPMGLQERLAWRSEDGTEVDGLLVLPPGKSRADGPLPLVILVHGGPYGRVADSLEASGKLASQWLAGHGYAVFLPNPRGGSGHGPAFASAVAAGVGGLEWADVATGIDHLVGAGVADPGRLALMGWSQGGFLTAWGVGQTPRFRCGIMGAGVSDWGMMVAESDMPTFEGKLGGSTGWEGAGPHPHDARSPISYAQRVQTPLLILHGERDERVPVGQARFMYRALRAAGVPCELVVYPREPHSFKERAHVLDLHQRVLDWLARWMG